MNDNTSPPVGNAARWLRDDLVLIGFASFCLLVSLYLRLWGGAIEPTFISIFVGVGVAAITYRYLGGTEGAQFSIAALKLGGSAALLLAVTWWVGSAMTKERGLLDIDARALRAQRDATEVKQALERDIESKTAQISQLNLEVNASDKRFVERVANLDGDNRLVTELREALRNPSGAGSSLARKRQVRIMNSGSVGGKKSFWICRDTYQGFYPDQSRAGDTLRMMAVGIDGQPIELLVKYSGEIDRDVCSSNGRQFDMQVSCDASEALFPDLVTGCDGSRPRFSHSEKKVRTAEAGVPINPQ